MKLSFAPTLIVLSLVTAVAPTWAHHVWPVNNNKLVTVKGTVVDFDWANPHPMITLKVQASDGRTEIWKVGGPALNRMEANGWTKTTVKPGDVITGVGYQYTNGEKIIKLEHVVFADGKQLLVYGGR